jgi:acyl-coenzyme A synthetase/AMP-(fatty) acid ligase
MSNKNMAGKASIDRPWMQYYPEAIAQLQVPQCTLFDYVKSTCPGMDVSAMNYYGTDILWESVFTEIEAVAKALKAVGFKEGDQIPVFLQSVPQFISLLLAAEKIGASLLCRDNTIEENAEAVAKAEAKVIIAHDFLSQEDMDFYVKEAGVEKVILLSPYYMADRSQIPDYVEQNIQARYPEKTAQGELTMSWDEFMALADTYEGEVDAPADINRPLFRAYTSGSTGPSKQVIHSANTMMSVIFQMSPYGASGDFRPKWMVTCLPPCLVAVVVSMLLTPLTSNKYLILDPFVDVNDIDLELMRYQPNIWPLIPMFFEIVMHSKRIPEDYDMSHILAAGAGCEAYNNGQLARSQAYLEKHNCHITFTASYGQSEAGSNMTFPSPAEYKYGDGNIGIPMPLSNMSIFKPGTTEELGYNELGEICQTAPSNMLGYDNEEATAKTLIRHEDGNLWLHTGDIGYVNEDGIFYVLTRGNSQRFGGGRLIALTMENRVIDAKIEGIKDAFFVIVPDDAHPGYFLPYLYVVLKDGYTIADIEDKVCASLEKHEIPVEINELPERPFFHFKTNRIGLTREIQAAN